MKTALVTGGSRGIGAATVEKFAREGYTVILNYHNSKVQAEQLKQNLLENGCDVHLYCADVSSPEEVSQMFSWIGRLFKHLDVLVNNAGVSMYKQCQDVASSEYDAVMGTNAKGVFLCSCEAVKMFLKQGHGAIVNVSSIWGIYGASCESVYSMSKHAVIGLTKSLALELSGSNISVNCVCPPIVATDMVKHLSSDDVTAFCAEFGVKQYSAQDVAQDIFNLATANKSGVILEEK